MSDEWYRGPRWDRDARAEFERRLSRARDYNRPQYLRVKAVALWEAGKLDAARTALSLPDRGPQLPRHPTVGLVTADKRTLTWLRRLATDG